jgi:hypothetical protein
VEEDRHGIFYSDKIDVFKGIFNGRHRYFKFISSDFIDGMCVVALVPAVIINKGVDFPSSSSNTID